MKALFLIINCIVVFTLANIVNLSTLIFPILFIPLLVVLFILINIKPTPIDKRIPTKALKICNNGCSLLIIFLITVTSSIVFNIFLFMIPLPIIGANIGLNLVVLFFVEAVVFWNGIIRVYLTSLQLGIRIRVIGIICGMIPIANLIALIKIIKTASKEVSFETYRSELDKSRKDLQICQTKYPILLVHGVFFRDFKYVYYWGRIPEALKNNGATIYYGEHRSAASVADCGIELAEKIKNIVTSTGCEKVNIIAHSKGGLDSRYAISQLGCEEYVASLTTINTPHRGCLFARYLLNNTAESVKNTIASGYNNIMNTFGEKNSDFMAAVTDLTDENCAELNKLMPDSDKIFKQSVGSRLNRAVNGKFPLNFTYPLVKQFGGENDGLVSKTSFEWGEKFTYITVNGKRGISHGDMIDLNRENIPDFDVREFYVQLVADLKSKGY